ncbi:SDR family oxidoreductase [Pseudonocardia nematodicida]|uniref:SDR family oxidoreductase n=1 Tax=Pseudonocardia nematodicida TaxID=1206997 RepID=A0ABV1K8W9_9PSEU
MLEARTAVVYVAAGSVGRAVARAFADKGARVHLTGRTLTSLHGLADELTASGASVSTTALDVTDAAAMSDHARSMKESDGRIDIAFTAVTYDEVQGTALHDIPVDDVERTLMTTSRAHLHAVRAIAPYMIEQHDGVIQTMVGYGPPHPLMGSTALAWQLVEAMYRQFAVELGPSGVRVQWFRTGGFRESILDAPDYGSSYARDTSTAELLASLEEGTALGRIPSVHDAGAFAAFAASSAGRSLTATGFNMTSGAFSD